MKRMLTIIFAACLCAAAVIAAEEVNPHKGLTSLIKTNWDHKDGNRLLAPKVIRDAVELMNSGAAWKGDASRPTMGHVFATPNNVVEAAKDPENPKWWDIVEDWRYERFQLQGGQIIHSMQINTVQVPQMRLFMPAKKNAAGVVTVPDQYPMLYDVDHTDNSVRIGRMTSGVSKINYSNAITVHNNGTLSLGFAAWIPPVASPYPLTGYLDVSTAPDLAKSGWVVEKNGVKYLKLRHNYKQYGVKLEAMEW